MRVLVLGITGMLGHKLFQVLEDSDLTVYGTARQVDHYSTSNIYQMDALNVSSIYSVVRTLEPDVIVNCIGVVKQIWSQIQIQDAIYLNSILPHVLERYCEELGIRLVHISTDCVFSGREGSYQESDSPDPVNAYGWSKALGEVRGGHSLNLRTSIVGPELRNKKGLLEWLRSNIGSEIDGWTSALWNGLPTVSLSREIKRVILDYPDLSGIYHISSSMISKHDLLKLLSTNLDWDIKINPKSFPKSNMLLNCSKYQSATGYSRREWDPDLILELKEDILESNDRFRD